MADASDAPVLVVTATTREAQDLTAELRDVYGDAVTLLPSWETLPHERLSPGVDTVGARLQVLHRLAHPEDSRMGVPLRVVITTVRSLLQPMSPELFDLEPVELAVGAELEFDGVIARLVELAYTRVDMVAGRGEFAVRGGILDVFSPTADHPVRVEFWGDEVSEMRYFSVADQRSIPELEVDSVLAMPCRELLLTDQVGQAAELASAAGVSGSEEGTGSAPGVGRCSPNWQTESVSTEWNRFCPCYIRVSSPCWSTTCQTMRQFWSVTPKVRTRAADLERTGREFLEASWSVAAIGSDAPIDVEALADSGFRELDDVKHVAGEAGYPWWSLSPLGMDNDQAVGLAVWPSPSSRGHKEGAAEIFAMLRAHVMTGGRAAVVAAGAGTTHRIIEQLAETETPATLLEPGAEPAEGVVGVLRGHLTEGVVLGGANIVIVTETDLTGSRVAATDGKRLPAKRRNQVDPLALSAGDLVVHDQHGIGRFVEMVERTVGGARREYLVLEYASGKRGAAAGGQSDRLYVPMDSLDQLSRYVGGESPGLSRLGGSDWTNTKTKARKAVREIAGNSLRCMRHARPRQDMPSLRTLHGSARWRTRSDSSRPSIS